MGAADVRCGADHNPVQCCGSAVLGAIGIQSRRGRRSHGAARLVEVMIKACAAERRELRCNRKALNASVECGLDFHTSSGFRGSCRYSLLPTNSIFAASR
jgi:hypothetical protein